MEKNFALLIGDPFLSQEKFQALCRLIEIKHPGEIMLQSCRLSDVPFGRVLSDARTLPFLCSAQVFRIRDIERIKKEDVEELELYSQKPTAGTYLIF